MSARPFRPAKPIFSDREFAEASLLADRCRADPALLISSLLELQAMRRLHRASLKVLKGPGDFVLLLQRLPDPGSQAWYSSVARRIGSST